MTTNGKPAGQAIQQVAPVSDLCPNCGHRAMVSTGVMQLRPSYIHLERGQPQQGRLVLAYVLCFHCLRRDVHRWDDAGKQSTETVFAGEPQPEPAS